MNPLISIRLNTRILPFLVGLLLILQVLAPYDGWLMLLAGLGGAWLAAYVWVRLLSTRLTIRRERRYGWAQVGDRLEERFTLINRAWLPALWVEVRDGSAVPGYEVSRAASVGSLSTTRWQTQGICRQRGLFHLGQTTLRTGDPLGIYTLEIYDPHRANLLVTPPLVPLPEIEIAPGGRTGEGRPRPHAPEPSVSTSAVRQYTPGDSLRYIHWRTSAHQDDLFVRMFEGQPAGNWWIILDGDAGAQVGEGQDSTLEHAIILAASLAGRGLRENRPVGVVASGAHPVWLPPREGDGQRWEILLALARLQPAQHTLAELLARMKPALGRRDSLILITSNTDPYWVQHLLPLLRTGAVPTVLLLDPQTFGGQGQPQPVLDMLAGLQIRRYCIGRGLLDRPEARPGQSGRWQFRISPRGRAIPVSQPEETPWKVLS